VELISKISGQVTPGTIMEMLRKGLLNEGAVLEFGKEAWKVLEVDTINKAALLFRIRGERSEVHFNRNGSNMYAGSDIQEYLEDVFFETLPEELKILAMEVPGCFLLSTDEVLRYMPKEIDRIVCDEHGNTSRWWTRTPVKDYRNEKIYTYAVLPGGEIIKDVTEYESNTVLACGLWIR